MLKKLIPDPPAHLVGASGCEVSNQTSDLRPARCKPTPIPPHTQPNGSPTHHKRIKNNPNDQNPFTSIEYIDSMESIIHWINQIIAISDIFDLMKTINSIGPVDSVDSIAISLIHTIDTF